MQPLRYYMSFRKYFWMLTFGLVSGAFMIWHVEPVLQHPTFHVTAGYLIIWLGVSGALWGGLLKGLKNDKRAGLYLRLIGYTILGLFVFFGLFYLLYGAGGIILACIVLYNVMFLTLLGIVASHRPQLELTDDHIAMRAGSSRGPKWVVVPWDKVRTITYSSMITAAVDMRLNNKPLLLLGMQVNDHRWLEENYPSFEGKWAKMGAELAGSPISIDLSRLNKSPQEILKDVVRIASSKGVQMKQPDFAVPVPEEQQPAA